MGRRERAALADYIQAHPGDTGPAYARLHACCDPLDLALVVLNQYEAARLRLEVRRDELAALLRPRPGVFIPHRGFTDPAVAWREEATRLASELAALDPVGAQLRDAVAAARGTVVYRRPPRIPVAPPPPPLSPAKKHAQKLARRRARAARQRVETARMHLKIWEHKVTTPGSWEARRQAQVVARSRAILAASTDADAGYTEK